MMPPLGSWQMDVIANCDEPPPAGSTATTMWFVLLLEMVQKISTGICVITFFMKRSTSVDGKALAVASAEMPIDSRSLPTAAPAWAARVSSVCGSGRSQHGRVVGLRASARRNVRASRAQGTSAGAPRTSSERTTSIFCDESQRGILRNTTGKMSAAEHQRDSSTVQIRALGQLVCTPEKEKVWRVA